MFRVNVDVTLPDLEDHLDWINGHLNHGDTRMVISVAYRRSSIDPNGNIRFLQIWRRCENHVVYIWPVSFKGTYQVRHYLREEIKVCMDEPDEYINLVDSWYCLCLIMLSHLLLLLYYVGILRCLIYV